MLTWTAGVIAGIVSAFNGGSASLRDACAAEPRAPTCKYPRMPAVQVAAALLLAMLAAPAFAQDATPPADAPSETLLSESVQLEVVDGSRIPDECHYPQTISDTARFELACVTMPRFVGGQLAMEYLGQLGTRGWQQGSYITGGMTAVHPGENDCQEVINIFPGDYPPGTRGSDIVVIWFARERAPRCPA